MWRCWVTGSSFWRDTAGSYPTEQSRSTWGAGSLILRVRGQNLTLRSMTDSEVRIFGKIDTVEYVR